MTSIHDILAKSANYGCISLPEHTGHVAEAIEVLAEKQVHSFNKELARKGAILHDLGKVHPHFQRKIKGIKAATLAATLYEKEEWDYIHRHELTSLGFLPCFPREEWDILIEMVVAHHKSIEKDGGGKGILDLEENDRDWLENHLKGFDQWVPQGLEILRHFGIDASPFPIAEAEKALQYAVDYCTQMGRGWSAWRGLLKAADHFASAFMDETASELLHLFKCPDLRHYDDPARKNDLYPLSKVLAEDGRRHTLAVAPTGAGKTDFLLRRCRGRVFYTLPFQASINAMYDRIRCDTGMTKEIRLLHATSRIVVGDKIDEQILQPMPGAAVKVLTPHQLAAIIFGTSGFETVMLDVQGCDVILDEIHTYSSYSRAMVLEIVKALLRLGCRIHIGTATMPSVLYDELYKILGGNEAVYEVNLPDEVLDKFDRHRIYKIEGRDDISGILGDAFASQEKVLMVFNTVAKAQEAYQEYSRLYPEIPTLLLHSRFKRGRRVELERELMEKFNGTRESKGHSPCLVISTQVVEVSLDISFDRMITECAPLDGMIQRFGRINRKRSEASVGHYKPIHVLKPQGNVLPYKMEVLKASFDQLPGHGEVLRERSLQEKINQAYPELDTKAIDIHLNFLNGEYRYKSLTDNPKAVLVEALEIESATCILEADRERYLTAHWEDRLYLEIPVNYKTIARYSGSYERLDIGSNPFVVPQDEAAHQLLGLQLIEHDYIL